MGSAVDLTGERYGRLTVISRSHKDKHGYVHWNCICDCGNTVSVCGCSLRKGHTKSCGCLHREVFSSIAKNNRTHGMSKDRLYKIWSSMKMRCQDENHSSYKDYGGRGISVCNLWNTFEPFYEWAMSNGYSPSLTIDRIDNNGNYCPENCRWADKKTQSNNKRNNRIITIHGEKHTLSQWSDISGVKKNTIQTRLRKGWNPEDAIFQPLLRNRRDIT